MTIQGQMLSIDRHYRVSSFVSGNEPHLIRTTVTLIADF